MRLLTIIAVFAVFLARHPALADPIVERVQSANTSTHRPPIGPGRSCDSASMRDPYTALICTDDGLSEAWLILNQEGYALRNQMGDDAYRQLMSTEGAASWKQLTSTCFIAPGAVVTDAMRATLVPCLRQQIYLARSSRLALLSPPALEETNRDIHAHIAFQQGLIEHGYLPGPTADGSYGPATRDAISRFQREHGLQPNGFMTNATAQALVTSPVTQPLQAPTPLAPATPVLPDSGPTTPSADDAWRTQRHDFPTVNTLASRGSGDDLLLLLNTAPDAPNASLTLAGEPTFIGGRAKLCHFARTPLDTIAKLALDQWLGGHKAAVGAPAIPRCDDDDGFADLDGVVATRASLKQVPVKLFNDIGSLLPRYVQSIVVFSAMERKAVEDQVRQARADTDKAIGERRPGIGYVSFAGQSEAACVIAATSEDVWPGVLASLRSPLEIDLGYNFELKPTNFDPDAAYAAARKGDCRMILGTADQLAAVRAASDRDHLTIALGSSWIAPDTVDRAAGEIKRQREAEEQSRQAAQRQQAAAAQAARDESEQRTRVLRTQSEADATGMKDTLTARVVDLFKSADGRDITQNWAATSFPVVGQEGATRARERWEFVSNGDRIIEYGFSTWNGRSLATAIIEERLHLKNADLGRYDDLCFVLAYQRDNEFSRTRETRAFRCGSAGDLDLRTWLTSVNFASAWNAP